MKKMSEQYGCWREAVESCDMKRYGRYISKDQSRRGADGEVAYLLEAMGNFRKMLDFCYQLLKTLEWWMAHVA